MVVTAPPTTPIPTITCPTQHLAGLARKLKDVAAKENGKERPVLSKVRFQSSRKRLNLTAGDGTRYLVIQTDMACPAEINTCISADMLQSITGTLTGKEISLEFLPSGRAKILCDDQKFENIGTLPGGDYDVLPQADVEAFSISVASLRTICRRIAGCNDPKSIDPSRQGIHLLVDGKQLIATAVTTASVATQKVPLKAGQSAWFVVSPKDLRTLASLSDEGDIQFFSDLSKRVVRATLEKGSGESISFFFRPLQVAKLIDGRQFVELATQAVALEVGFDAQEAMAMVEASLITGELNVENVRVGTVQFNASPRNPHLEVLSGSLARVKNSENGYRGTIQADIQGSTDIECMFNTELVQKALKGIADTGRGVLLRLQAHNKPALFTLEHVKGEHQNYNFVLMPLDPKTR